MAKAKCKLCGADILSVMSRFNKGLCRSCARVVSRNPGIRENLLKPGCPECDGTRYFNFNWESALDASSPQLSKYTRFLKLVRPMKRGTLWGCSECNHKWYLDPPGKTMWNIPTVREELVDRWDREVLSPAEGELTALRRIGATPPDIYGNNSDRVLVPCRVLTKSSEVCDPAVVSLQAIPPLETWPKNVRLIDEIATIDASQYALSAEVRLATADADELRMGFAPTYVEARDGQQFCLNWTQHFFIHPQWRASDIRLLDEPHRYRKDAKSYTSEIQAVYFVGDLKEEHIALRLRSLRPNRKLPIKLISTAPL
jgi:hypothetical protein